MAFNLQPILENDLLLLRPLHPDDFEDLYKVSSDPLIWALHPAKERAERVGFTAFFNDALAMHSALVAIDKKTGQIIGTSRYNPVKESTDAIEIGWTFLARAYWGGTYNQAMKKLMLDYAFQFVKHILFFIHCENWRSQKAVEKIGGMRITELDGHVLDSRGASNVIYAISIPLV